MKTKIVFLIAFVFIITYKTNAQAADEDAIKQTIKMETEAALKGDTTAWKNLYVQDEKTTVTFTGNGYNNNFIGWQNINSQVTPFVYSNRDSMSKYRFTDANFIINESGDIATAQHDRYFFKDNDTTSFQHEYNTLVKVDNDWKLVSLLSVNTKSYITADSATIENNLNGTGYQLLGEKKYNDAIEVFKLNVKLFPKSWNVYDSLGEAYADNGNKSEAIKNYELSLKINPQNDNGKQWLEKLKK